MPAMNLGNATKRTRVVNATAAGTSAINGTVLDMSGFDAVLFEVLFGTLTATQVTSIKAQAGNLANGSDMSDIAGTSTGPLADADSNKMLVLDLIRPAGYRYVRLVIVRGTANAVVDGAVATQYYSKKMPETDDTTVSARKTVQFSALGTP
jgi:hypothetical protein